MCGAVRANHTMTKSHTNCVANLEGSQRTPGRILTGVDKPTVVHASAADLACFVLSLAVRVHQRLCELIRALHALGEVAFSIAPARAFWGSPGASRGY